MWRWVVLGSPGVAGSIGGYQHLTSRALWCTVFLATGTITTAQSKNSVSRCLKSTDIRRSCSDPNVTLTKPLRLLKARTVYLDASKAPSYTVLGCYEPLITSGIIECTGRGGRGEGQLPLKVLGRRCDSILACGICGGGIGRGEGIILQKFWKRWVRCGHVRLEGIPVSYWLLKAASTQWGYLAAEQSFTARY